MAGGRALRLDDIDETVGCIPVGTRARLLSRG
jgi:hypothetical protein